ncbi:AraC family transcriptional regulator [Paenibacillus sp. FSL K6-1318]|uniref:AraC family transcriptional regulator n=1 Tax=Paenibacillus sp. FSL K6-1318 TaxID=2975291 RepID=UPI0030EF07CC
MDIVQYQFSNFSKIHNVDLKLYYCGTEQCLPGHEVGPMVRDYYKIHYIHSGKGRFHTGGRTYTLGKGQGFLISPEKLAHYQADDEAPWTYSWIAFNGMQVERYLKRSSLSNEQPVFSSNRDEYIQSCFLEMFKATEHNLTDELRLLGALYSFLSVILDPASMPVTSPGARGQYVEQAIAFIEHNYATDLSVEQLAARLKINRKYLSKIFKDTTGFTPQQYVIQYRMNRASELIQKSSLSMNEIACSVGYKDPFQFSRMFKKVMGAAPRDYRNDKKE